LHGLKCIRGKVKKWLNPGLVSKFNISLTVLLQKRGIMRAGTELMEIQFFEDPPGKSLTAKISGECDLYNSHHLYQDIVGKMDGRCGKVYVDFAEVPYMDSSGIGAVIRIIQHSRNKNIDLRFRGIAGTVRKVLRLSNILSLIREDGT
jgi:anti-sigma B factor antagonist